MQLQKIFIHAAVEEAQETALRNTQFDCKMNEKLAQQEHVRRVNLIATRRFLHAIPL